MRILTVVCLLALTVAASAQQRSGRHFHHESRLPVTPAATKAVEATTQRHVKPIPKLRSGRAWPRFHFRRLPAAKASVETSKQPGTVDAAAQKSPQQSAKRSSGFWGPRK